MISPTDGPRHSLLLALFAGLLLVAVAPVSAAEIQTDVSDLPFSDDQQVRTANFYVGQVEEQQYSGNRQMFGRVVFNNIENFKNINYIQVDNKKGFHPFPEGRSEFYYKRPSDGKICEAFALTTLNRNLLGQVVYARTTYFFVDWEIGTKVGRYTSLFYSDPGGSSQISYVGYSNNYETSFSDISGDPAVKADVQWVRKSYREAGESTVYVETYSDDRFGVSFETTGLSVLTKIQRVFDSPCLSQIYMNDSAGNPVFSDRDLVDKEFYYPASKCAKCTVRMGDNSYIYNLPGSGPSPENDDFSLSLDRSEAANYDTVTATLTAAAGAPEYDEIAWIHRDEQRTFSRLSDGAWKEFNYDTLEYDIGSDEHTAHNYQFEAYCPPGVDDPEDLVICCLYSQGKQIAELSGRVAIVAGSTKTQLAVVVVDYTEGQTPVLFGADVEVRDEKTKQLQQETGSDETFHRFILEKGRRYIVTADAPGYKSSSRTITATKDVQSTEIYLSKEAPITAPDNSTQIGFVVTDGQYRHVEGALIRLTDQTTGSTLSGLTNQYGALTFLVDRTHQYQYAVSKTGYIGVQGAADLTGTTTVRLLAEGDGLGEGDQPGHDSRTIDQKATSALGILFDQVELIAALAGLILVCNMLTWILPGGGRRR